MTANILHSTENSMRKNYTPVTKFYEGKSLFITGGTGFCGKILVEKLLRSCSGLKCIYLLIRPKKNKDIVSRLDELINSPLFDRVRKENPNVFEKLVPICGDITSEELGISECDQTLLCENVSIVFHSAATIKFDEKLKLSVTINMLGTKRLVELCHRMKHLQALVHVSTAYCNCDRFEIHEKIYNPQFNPDEVIALTSWLPEHLLDEITPSLIGSRPNTYTFTKALAESMLETEAKNLPVAIVRPSIVLSSLKEPFVGWVDNWNGPTGIVSAVGKGLFRTIICKETAVADLVPVDIVINLLITAAWDISNNHGKEIKVYNCCTGEENPITWGKFVHLAIENMRKHPLEGVLWYPTGILRQNRIINEIHGVLTHYIPAYILDICMKFIGKKPIMVKIEDKLAKAVDCLEYFTTHQWKFHNDNVRQLTHNLDEKDRQTFVTDVNALDWDKYVEFYVLGFREFLFKQDPCSLPSTRLTMKKLHILHQAFKVFMVFMVWQFLMHHSPRLNSVWRKFFQAVRKLLQIFM